MKENKSFKPYYNWNTFNTDAMQEASTVKKASY